MRTLARVLAAAVVLSAVVALAPGQTESQEETGTIQIVQGGIGEGTVTSNPAGIDCTLGGPDGPTGACEATFPAGTRVKLTADAAPGSKFEGWAPVNSCPKPKNLTVVGGRTHNCQPVFAHTEPPELLLQVALEGSGTVTSFPVGIDCTADADAGTLTGQCGNTLPNGSEVTLTASPREGWTFVEWRDGAKGRDCEDGVVTMDEAKRCIAVFARSSP